MFDAAWNRLEFLGELRKHRIARWLFLLWAIVGIYDLVGSEFLPPELAQKRPTIYQLISMTSGWLSWNAWLLIGAVLLVIFALEYVARHKREVVPASKAIGLSEEPDKLEPDIDAGAAFHQILNDSEWRQEQLAVTRDTSNLARNWLEIRLDTEIHKALVNSRLQAWGEEVLANGAVAPERPIPADTWIKVEIVFGRIGIPRTSANWRVNLPYTGKTAWAGVKFSKRQIFELFPLSSPLRPLKIIFDPSNPGKKFWSIETPRMEPAKQLERFGNIGRL